MKRMRSREETLCVVHPESRADYTIGSPNGLLPVCRDCSIQRRPYEFRRGNGDYQMFLSTNPVAAVRKFVRKSGTAQCEYRKWHRELQDHEGWLALSESELMHYQADSQVKYLDDPFGSSGERVASRRRAADKIASGTFAEAAASWAWRSPEDGTKEHVYLSEYKPGSLPEAISKRAHVIARLLDLPYYLAECAGLNLAVDVLFWPGTDMIALRMADTISPIGIRRDQGRAYLPIRHPGGKEYTW